MKVESDYPAFPATHPDYTVPQSEAGMSIRTWLAGMAMQGIMADGRIETVPGVANESVRIADALLDELNK